MAVECVMSKKDEKSSLWLEIADLMQERQELTTKQSDNVHTIKNGDELIPMNDSSFTEFCAREDRIVSIDERVAKILFLLVELK